MSQISPRRTSATRVLGLCTVLVAVCVFPLARALMLERREVAALAAIERAGGGGRWEVAHSTLGISVCTCVHVATRRIPRRVAVPVFNDLPNLRVLELQLSDVEDGDIESVGRLKHLETLRLNSTKVTDRGVEALRGCVSLRELRLRRTGVTGSGFSALASMPNLTILIADQCPLTDSALDAVCACRGLTELEASSDALTDGTLAHLATVGRFGTFM